MLKQTKTPLNKKKAAAVSRATRKELPPLNKKEAAVERANKVTAVEQISKKGGASTQQESISSCRHSTKKQEQLKTKIVDLPPFHKRQEAGTQQGHHKRRQSHPIRRGCRHPTRACQVFHKKRKAPVLAFTPSCVTLLAQCLESSDDVSLMKLFQYKSFLHEEKDSSSSSGWSSSEDDEEIQKTPREKNIANQLHLSLISKA